MSPLEDLGRRWDLGLFGAAALLVAISNVAMASAAATIDQGLWVRHTVWTVLGVLAFLGVSQSRSSRWGEGAVIGYALSLLALLLVEAAGVMRLGATRWLSLFGLSVQPSELAKLATIWLLARYLAGQPTPLSPRALMVSLALAGVPAALILVQPDLGSASILGAIWLGMVWVAGISSRAMGALLGGLVASAPLLWHTLKDYQRDRLAAFIDPHADPLGVGYTIIQSTIAIGSGRLWGRGWFAGTQNQLSFLPERHSDFIFSVIGEEWGWFGCLVLVAGFGLLLSRVARVARNCSDPQGRLFAAGIFTWLGYQAVVNMGMVMGLLPVVGVPLPLISYGGSSMVMIWTALGLVSSIYRAERVS